MVPTPHRPTDSDPGRERGAPAVSSEALERLANLPPAPGILLEIWDVLGSENGSARRLAVILEHDTSLSAKLLKLANSAYFSAPRAVADVRTACVVLGFDMVRSIAISVASLEALTRRAGRVLDRSAFWRHSVAVGLFAKELSPRAGIGDPGTAFCAGVLHDAGKLALAMVDLDGYRRVIERFAAGAAPPDASPDDVRAAERAELGLDHEEAGRVFGARWNFPSEILAAVSSHHEPWSSPSSSRWGALLHVSDWAARRSGFDSAPSCGRPVPDAPDSRGLRRLGLSTDDLAATLARTADSIPVSVSTFSESFR